MYGRAGRRWSSEGGRSGGGRRGSATGGEPRGEATVALLRSLHRAAVGCRCPPQRGVGTTLSSTAMSREPAALVHRRTLRYAGTHENLSRKAAVGA